MCTAAPSLSRPHLTPPPREPASPSARAVPSLTISTAIAYLTERAALHTAVAARLTTTHAVPTVTVEFADTAGRAYVAEVWLEGGRLYGEW